MRRISAERGSKPGCYSRMPKPLLALMERPGSARFFVMEGMLTEPLKPARLS